MICYNFTNNLGFCSANQNKLMLFHFWNYFSVLVYANISFLLKEFLQHIDRLIFRCPACHKPYSTMRIINFLPYFKTNLILQFLDLVFR